LLSHIWKKGSLNRVVFPTNRRLVFDGHVSIAATRREFVGRCLEKRGPKPRGFSNQFFQSIIKPPIALKLMCRANRRFHAKIISGATRKYKKNKRDHFLFISAFSEIA
jgi:hypothetical protein